MDDGLRPETFKLTNENLKVSSEEIIEKIFYSQSNVYSKDNNKLDWLDFVKTLDILA